MIISDFRCLMIALYSLSIAPSQQKVCKITVFLLVFLRSCAACFTCAVEISEMPIYEYRCDNCGHELEAIQKLSEDPLTRCPKCDTDNLTKKISAAGFRLKGGGWYETDFKSGNKKNVAGSENSSGGSDGGSSGGDSSKDKATGNTADKSSGSSSSASSSSASGTSD